MWGGVLHPPLLNPESDQPGRSLGTMGLRQREEVNSLGCLSVSRVPLGTNTVLKPTTKMTSPSDHQ